MHRPIAQRIRAKIAAGALPIPEQTVYGVSVRPGDGRACDGCDTPIGSGDVIFEIGLPERQLGFHAECLVAWHTARPG